MLAAVVGGLMLGASMAVPAQAAEQGAAGIALTSLAVGQDTVDATSGSGTVTFDWTVTDGDAAATDMFGALSVQQIDDDGNPVGAPHDLTFSFQRRWGYQANPVEGTMASARYSYAFQVPQYAAGSTARWSVVQVTAKDDQGGKATVGRQTLDSFHATFTATELIDSTGPAQQQFGRVLNEPEYLNNAEAPVTVRYWMEVSDAESGFHRAQLLLSGPQGATATGSVQMVSDPDNPDGALTCGDYESYDNLDVFCTIAVVIPAGAPAGDWSPTRLRLFDDAGNIGVSRDLPAAPVHVTQNSTLTASDFALSPSQFNNWNGVAQLAFTFKPSGVRDGIASVTVLSDECSGSVTPKPAISADGTVSVRVSVPPIYTRKCTVSGVGLVDGAGDAAAYGVAFHGPALDVAATQIPDTAAPVVNAASLDKTSVPASALPSGARLSLDVTSFVGVKGFSLTVYDSNGSPVDGESGGIGPVTSGPLVLNVPLHAGLAPGVYTVGFDLTDAGGLRSPYGYPSGPSLPVPGGPLLITVTGD